MKQRIVILGAGESGTGAALLGISKGYEVFVSDSGEISSKSIKEFKIAGIDHESGNHTPGKILDADTIIKSPGIPEDADLVVRARENGIPVISEIEFAFKHSVAKFIAITGTNGKTTTTNLVYHLLKESGFNVGLAGNVGISLARQIATENNDWYVVELSSFQLDGMYEFHPSIAVLLNITPDHLNRYNQDFSEYVASKFRILQNMKGSDEFIFWADDEVISEKLSLRNIVSIQRGVSINHDGTYGYETEKSLVINGFEFDKVNLPLAGRHNYVNMMCAISAALAAGVSEQNIKDNLVSFKSIPHRMEKVGEINGIQFVNDSKATNVDATYYALDTYPSITWIAGGQDKGNDYSRLVSLVKEKVDTLICLGVDNTKLEETFRPHVDNIFETEDIKEAAKKGLEYSKNNDVVLLSPACASFDLFQNYEDRGDQYREAIEELSKEINAMSDQNQNRI